MPALDDYIYATEPLADDNAAAGFVVPRLSVDGTATSGVGTPADGAALPAAGLTGEASWQPAGAVELPLLAALATTDGWRPAWGRPALPVLQATGQGLPRLGLDLLLPPLFAVAEAGAAGQAALPAVGLEAATTMERSGDGVVSFSVLRAAAYACSLANPVTAGVGSDAVVALLNRQDSAMALAATALAGGACAADGDDALAGALLDGVARHLAYVVDADGEDVWTCAGATYFRGSGDCEDGAILLHALLLAAGVAADRLVTAFGRVDLDRTGHAWVGYRRRSDGRFVALDWTLGPDQGGVGALPLLDEPGFYAVVDYALSATTFVTVRRDATAFFMAAPQVALRLPVLGVFGTGRCGARCAATFRSAWTCLGRCGVTGDGRLPCAVASGLAGSAVGTAVAPSLALAAGAGARGRGALSCPVLAGRCGGAGRAWVTFFRPGGIATGRCAQAGCGRLVLPRVRSGATGLAGLAGRGGVAMPWAVAQGTSCSGGMAACRCRVPLPGCAVQGGTPVVGRGVCVLPDCRLAAWMRPEGGDVDGYVWNCCAGEAWT